MDRAAFPWNRPMRPVSQQSDTEVQVFSPCMDFELMHDASRINLKLGGINYIYHSPAMEWFSQALTMIMGQYPVTPLCSSP